MKDNLIPFPTVKKGDRLKERARIVAENFSHPDYGIPLMIYMTRKMYETFASCEADFLEFNVLSKLHELEGYLSEFQGEENEEGNSD
jgi:hypothetical protein